MDNPNKILKFISPIINHKETNSIIAKSLKSGLPNEGYITKEFEKKISKLLNVKHVVATTSGTIAIFLALKALGINKRHEVIVPNITFAATVNAVSLTGAKPVLADVDKETLLLNLDKLKSKISKKTKAIIPVHVSGRGSNIKKLKEFSKKFKIKLVEDAAEAFMSKVGKKFLGTYGDLGCFSFSPPKIITTGQGGVVVTNDTKLFKKILQLKNQGRVGFSNGGEDKYESIGYNFKFTNIQSALGISQLNSINWRKNKLIKNYKLYKKYVLENSNLKIFNFNISNGEVPLWVDIYCKKRNKLHKFLLNQGFECRLFWHPINFCKPYKKSFKGLENSLILKEKLMWLPSSLSLSEKKIKKICNLINYFSKKYL